MEKKFKLITRESCSYCDNAKNILQQQNYDYEELLIGKDIERDAVLETWPTQKMLPIVLVDDRLIGGYIELVDYLHPPMIDNFEEEMETMANQEFKNWFLNKLEKSNCRITYEKSNGDHSAIDVSKAPQINEKLTVIDNFNGKSVSIGWEDMVSYDFGDMH